MKKLNIYKLLTVMVFKTVENSLVWFHKNKHADCSKNGFSGLANGTVMFFVIPHYSLLAKEIERRTLEQGTLIKAMFIWSPNQK
jgi:hypothetical protein